MELFNVMIKIIITILQLYEHIMDKINNVELIKANEIILKHADEIKRLTQGNKTLLREIKMLTFKHNIEKKENETLKKIHENYLNEINKLKKENVKINKHNLKQMQYFENVKIKEKFIIDTLQNMEDVKIEFLHI